MTAGLRAFAAAFAATALAASAQEVQRCEAADGRVSYASGPCPPGTKAVRALPPAAVPTDADRQAARQRAEKDQRRVAEIERGRKADEARAARQQEQQLAKARKQEAHCRRLQSRLQQAQDELASAALAKRAEAQRRVKRAEQLYAEDCGPSAR